MAAEIPLTKGLVALIDDEDLPLVSGYRWHARESSHVGLIYASAWCAQRGRHILMHRLLLGIVDAGRAVLGEHGDGNGLNNRRYNIRVAGHWQNMANTLARNSSGYKGVKRLRGELKWQANIGRDGAGRYLGQFNTAEEAALAYDAAARVRYGEFACLNFPGPGERPARPQGVTSTLGADLIQSSQEACVLHGHTMERKHEPSPERYFDENGKTRDDHVPGHHR